MESLICNVCNSNDWKPVYEKQVMHPLWCLDENNLDLKLNYFICQECGYITLFPRLRFDEYETYYNSVPAPSRDSFSKRSPMLQMRKSFIMDHISRATLDTAIEVGPAYGDFLLLLSEVDKRIGIEPSKTYCELVNSSEVPFVYYCNMLENVRESAPELLSSADLVMASNVLEHAFDPRAFVKHLVALVKPAGFVYIEVPGVEAMAECSEPIYQIIHFGHISQFSIPVLNKLCISESLEPVEVELTAKYNYPVLRALYKKSDDVDTIAKYFRTHCDFLDEQAAAAKKTLVEKLISNNQIVIWGCGQDLLDILALLDIPQCELLAKKAKLVDKNKNKQNKKLNGIDINDPNVLLSDPIDTVLISSRSQLIQSDINSAAEKLFPDAQIVCLYPSTANER